MLDTAKAFKQKSKWLFVAPVQGVILTEDVHFKFRIIDTTLVDISVLEEYLHSIGAGGVFKILDKENNPSFHALTDKNKTFAVRFFSGSPELDNGNKWRLEVQKELDLLSASQLGFGSRNDHSRICLAIAKKNTTFGAMLVNMRDQDSGGFVFDHDYKGLLLALNGRWQSYCHNVFFDNLLSVVRGETSISDSWQKSLHRSAILAGQSCNSNDTIQSFMWLFAALDNILGFKREKGAYFKVLERRAEALLGWCEVWNREYKRGLKDIYKKRNDFVHRGEREEITESDIILMEDVLKNIFLNIVGNVDDFADDEKFLDYVKKLEADSESDFYLKTLRLVSKLHFSPPSEP